MQMIWHGLKEYYKDIRNDCICQNTLSAFNPKLINNPAIYSLLFSKYVEALAFNISFEVTFLANLSDFHDISYILSRIIGILLDNAISAAKDSPEKKIFLVTEKRFDKTIISIENSYSNKNVDINKIREKGYTSKSSEQGLHGLRLMGS